MSNPHTAPLAAPIKDPWPAAPEIAPPTAPLAAPTPVPTAVLVATRPALSLPSSAPADSANCLHALISCSAISFPTDCRCAFEYSTGCALEQALSIMAAQKVQAIHVTVLAIPSEPDEP